MPVFKLAHATNVESAINALAAVQGAYQSIKILADALRDVDEPDDFDAAVRDVEQQQAGGHQGPEEAGKQVVKAVKTAANSSDRLQDKMLEMVALVITRLGYSQGSRVLSLLLITCGVDPSLTLVVFKLCVLLGRTNTGRRIIAATLPRLKEVAAGVADKTTLDDSILQIADQLGDKGNELLSAWSEKSREAANKTVQMGSRIFTAVLVEDDLKSKK